MRRRFLFAAATLAVSVPSFGQAPSTYPDKPIRLVITYPPGGSSDLMCRIIGQKLGAKLGQPVLVDNRAGAAGSLGMEFAARQPADGYTILFSNIGPALVNPLLSKVPYDTAKDFLPVSLVATGGNVLVVNSSMPAHTVAELIAYAKSKPGGLNFGSGGAGTLAHLFGEMLNKGTGIKAAHVPYRGGIAAVNDLLAGQIDMIFSETLPVMQHIKAGKLRAIAVTSPQRSAQLPDVPTFAESGHPEIVGLNAWMIYLPTGTPATIASRIKKVLDEVMTDPDLVRQFREMGVEPTHSSADELRKFSAIETKKYGALIKEQNIKAD